MECCVEISLTDMMAMYRFFLLYIALCYNHILILEFDDSYLLLRRYNNGIAHNKKYHENLYYFK